MLVLIASHVLIRGKQGFERRDISICDNYGEIRGRQECHHAWLFRGNMGSAWIPSHVIITEKQEVVIDAITGGNYSGTRDSKGSMMLTCHNLTSFTYFHKIQSMTNVSKKNLYKLIGQVSAFFILNLKKIDIKRNPQRWQF